MVKRNFYRFYPLYLFKGTSYFCKLFEPPSALLITSFWRLERVPIQRTAAYFWRLATAPPVDRPYANEIVWSDKFDYPCRVDPERPVVKFGERVRCSP